MSVTLPLRLCMGVTMGPALTEAASQAIKLPENTPASSDPVSAGKQADDQTKKENQTIIPAKKSRKCLKPDSIEVSPVSYLGGKSLRTVGKQSTLPKLQGVVGTIAVPGQIKNIVIHKGVLFPKSDSKKSATSLLCGQDKNKTGTMNPTVVDKEGAKYGNAKHGGHTVRNRPQAHGEVRGKGKASTARPSHMRTSGHLYVSRPGGHQYPGTLSIKPASQNATTLTPTKAVGNVNYRHLKHASVHKALDCRESTSDVHEVDRAVTEHCDEAAKKQAQLERRIEFLQRRLRRVQSRQVEQHTRQELSSFASHQRQNLQVVPKSPNKSSLGCQGGGDDLNKELLSDGAKHMSTAALVSLVHKMQKQGTTSQLPVLVKPEVTTVLNMLDEDRKDATAAAAKMTMNLNMMQAALDSDATESSSGGETDTEDGPDAQHALPATPLLRRAEWKWASQRSSTASRWTWLQAQVSDLEYRIRLQTDLFRQARTSKGLVVLAEPAPPQSGTIFANQASWCSHDGRVSALPPSAVPQGSRQLQSSGDMQTSQTPNKSVAFTGSNPPSSSGSSHSTSGDRSLEASVNRVTSVGQNVRGGKDAEDRSAVDHPTHSPHPFTNTDPVFDPTCRAARCFPLKHTLRKRKLVRMSALESNSAKVAKLSTVKCHCHPAMPPCVLCLRKDRNLQTVDPHYMSFQERVSLMDPSFHPVLSFREEVPLSVHYEGLLRSGEWQNKPPVRRLRAEQGQRAQKHKLPSLGEGRKALLRKNQSSVIIQSAKIRNKYEQKAGRKLNSTQGLGLANRTLSTDLKCRSHAQFNVGRGRGRRRRGQGSRRGGYMRRGMNASLCEDAGFLREREVRRRRGESAYDINSIVIPRSMAALTRVEKLEYKEIPIPSWREAKQEMEAEEEALKAKPPAPKSNGLIAKETPESEEVEDLSDDSYIQRHSICEMAEKKRFSSAIRLPHGRRRARAVAQKVATPGLHEVTRPPTPSTPVMTAAAAAQMSMDSEDMSLEESDSRHVDWDMPHPHSPTLSTPPISSVGRSGHERQSFAPVLLPPDSENASPGQDFAEQSSSSTLTSGWPLRSFPLTEEEVVALEREDRIIDAEKEQPKLPGSKPHIPNLCPQTPGETGGSQAGSSVCGSLPPSPSPHPSTSSASVGGGGGGEEDWDVEDSEWTLDDDVKKKGGRTKSSKR